MELAKHWRQRAARYRLEGRRHRNEGTICFPPQPAHEGAEWEPYALSGNGIVYSFSVVRQPPAGYEQPYITALVQLVEGPMITTQLTDIDIEQVTIGMPVEMVTRRLRTTGDDGLIVYGYKFRPIVQ